MRINLNPRFHLGDFLRLPGNPLHYLTGTSVGFFMLKNARTALYQAIKPLYSKSRNVILMPSYNCGDEVEAVISAGYSPIFYSIDNTCQPDLIDLERRIKTNVFAVHTTHFNGFSQPISQLKEICNKYSIYLIEDCAHVLNTKSDDHYLGTFGDISIFSLRKYLPIRNGGVLVINNETLADKISINTIESTNTLSDIIFFTSTWVREHFTYDKGTAKNSINSNVTSTDTVALPIHDFRHYDYNKAISPLSSMLINRLDLTKIAEVRRDNYIYLYRNISNLDGLRCIQGLPSKEECPLHLLIEVQNPWEVGKYLYRKSVSSMVFWSHFHHLFPFLEHPLSVYLKNHVLALPIHQDLREEDMEKIGSLITHYYK